uniref:Chromodomain-helicase-DNA-binding protein 6-9 tri-helical domain-containing protein n=1 Tax=Romanomermis culicivorax TaxID=13658 RepID=A0A915KBD0_ROMCU
DQNEDDNDRKKSNKNQKDENEDDTKLDRNREDSDKNQKDEDGNDKDSMHFKDEDDTSFLKAGNILNKPGKDNEDDSIEDSEKQSLDDDSPLLALVAKAQEKSAKIMEKEPIEERPPTPVKVPPPFPSPAELSARFRKLIALHQRTYPKDLKFETESSHFLSRFAKKNLLQQSLLQEREMKRLEERQRWSKREEAEFYRALIAFGIEKNLDTGEIVWTRFKDLAKLRHKLDHTLTEYYHSFEAMCKRVCRRSLTQEEECLSYLPESLSEDRATKVCQRVDFMARLRSLLRPSNQLQLDERIKLAKKTPDLPDWWQIGKHDLDLLKGAAKHGLAKMEENIVLDPEFSFKEIFLELQKEVNSNRAVTRNLSKLTSGSSNEKVDAASTPTEKRYSTTDQIISDILSDQHSISSEILVHWPKERAVIMRLQNLCYLIEHGEWPTGNKAANLSTIPDWQSLAEPLNLELDPKYDFSDTQARLEEYKRNFGGSKLKSVSSMATSSANTKQSQALNLVDLYQATLANKMLKMKNYQTGNANLFDEITDSTDSARKHTGTGRRGRKPGSGNPNPLQDLMDGEK